MSAPQEKDSAKAKKKKIPTMSIPFEESRGPYIAALDIGSTASRGGLYDASGCPVKGSKQRISHAFTTDYDGTSVIDADQVVDECRDILTALVEFADEKGVEIAGVILDSFASSIVLVDATGNALTRAITYADSRCAPYVRQLREQIDESAYHARTGVRLHTSYHPARLAWLQADHPEVWEKTEVVMTIGEYVYFRLAGIRGQATASAAWAGILNLRTGQVDQEILDAVGVSGEKFDPIYTPQHPAHPANTLWEELNGKPWFHAIPDGWPSNVGPGAVTEDTVAVAAATSGAMRVILPTIPESVPEGLWCYRLDDSHAILGGALNDVGRAISWLEEVIAPVDPDELSERLATSPDRETPHVLPFFSGERATGWAANARATFTGMNDDTTALDVWYGVIEGIAISYERIWEELNVAGARPKRVIASGRVTSDYTNWLQILADAVEADVIPLAMKRATLRGTALIALEVLEPGGQRAEPPFGQPYSAREEYAEYYDGIREEFDRLYKALID